MKITGRNIKRRLYGLRNIPSNIKRARYWRGHGVHSPFVYNIVRQVFMCRELKSDDRSLYEALSSLGIPRRRCIQLQNLLHHCNYTTFEIDPQREDFSGVDMVIATIEVEPDKLATMTEKATQSGSTLCIMAPAYDAPRHKMCKTLVAQHRCTSIDNRGYLLLFNNYLPKQIFKL